MVWGLGGGGGKPLNRRPVPVSNGAAPRERETAQQKKSEGGARLQNLCRRAIVIVLDLP